MIALGTAQFPSSEYRNAAKRDIFLCGLALLILVPLLAAPVLTDDRIADDYHLVGTIGFSAALRYFYETPGISRNERPIVRLTFALDNLLWGKQAFGYHLTNVLLHTANCVLLLLVFLRLTGNLTMAFFSAALFGIHPVQQERLGWITARDGAVGMLFFLISLLTYLWSSDIRAGSEARQPSSQGPTQGFRVISVSAYLVALCSYEGAVTLPFLLVAVELLFNPHAKSWQDRAVQALRVTSPFFLVMPFYLAWWFFLFLAKPSEYDLNLSLHSMAHNFYRFHYRLFYGIQHWVAIVYLLLAALIWRERRQHWRLMLFSLLVIWIGFLPFLAINGFADRFAYFGAIGAVLFLGLSLTGITGLNRKIVPKTMLPVLLSLTLVGYFGYSITREFRFWIDAGRISEEVPTQLKALRASFPPDSTLVFDQIPRTVFMTSFEWAVRSKYAQAIPRIFYYPTVLKPSQSEKLLQREPAFYFRYLPKQERLVEISARLGP